MITPLFDAVVYGSTSGAVSSAVQCAILGLKVALVSPDEHIGGIQVEGLGATDIDSQAEVFNSTTLGGLSLELHRRISAHYGRLEYLEKVVKERIKDPEVWRFESCVAEKVIAGWLAEYPSIEIIKAILATEKPVIKDGSRVSALKLSNGRLVSGRQFIEASYEGDFLAAAGISTTHGREPSSNYKESLAGVRGNTRYTQIITPVDPYIVPGDPSSGLIYGISNEPFGCVGSGDKHLAAFSYRVPLTDDKENQLPIYKPEGYNPAQYELHRRYAVSGGALYTPKKRLPGGKTDLIGSEAPLATDLIGMNDEWATGTPAARQRILQDTAQFTKGLFWFFKTDEILPVAQTDPDPNRNEGTISNRFVA